MAFITARLIDRDNERGVSKTRVVSHECASSRLIPAAAIVVV